MKTEAGPASRLAQRVQLTECVFHSQRQTAREAAVGHAANVRRETESHPAGDLRVDVQIGACHIERVRAIAILGFRRVLQIRQHADSDDGILGLGRC